MQGGARTASGGSSDPSASSLPKPCPSARGRTPRATMAARWMSGEGNDASWAQAYDRWDPVIRCVAASVLGQRGHLSARVVSTLLDDVSILTWERLFAEEDQRRRYAADERRRVLFVARIASLSILRDRSRRNGNTTPLRSGSLPGKTPPQFSAAALDEVLADFGSALTKLSPRERRVLGARFARVADLRTIARDEHLSVSRTSRVCRGAAEHLLSLLRGELRPAPFASTWTSPPLLGELLNLLPPRRGSAIPAISPARGGGARSRGDQ